MTDKKLKASKFKPSGLTYEAKCDILNSIRARIITEDKSLAGLLTFVVHHVVPDGHPMYDQVAYTNGEEMFFCDRFFSQEIPIMCGIVVHEMLHIVFRHVSRGRNRIQRLFNVAADGIINDSIGYKQDLSLDGTAPIYLDKESAVSLQSIFEECDVPDEERLPLHDWTTESLYEYLIKALKKKLEKQVEEKEKRDKEKEEQEKGQKGDDKEPGSNQQEAEDGTKPGQSDDDCQSGGETPGDGEGEEGTSGEGDPTDGDGDGGVPGNSGGQSSQGNAHHPKRSNTALGDLEREIDDLLDRLAEKHDMFDGSDMHDEGDDGDDPANQQINDAIWTERFNRAKSQGYGKNNLLGRINPDVYQPQIKWSKELYKYLVKRCMPDTQKTYERPNRRMGSMPRSRGGRIFIPGILQKKGLDKMVVVIDTSGSCFNEEELTMFCTEIDSVQKQTGVEIHLIFADEDVEAEYLVKNDGSGLLEKMKQGKIKAEGGGGTDMVVPFIYGKEKYHPVVTVIATDGYTNWPTRAQVRGTNILWVINTEVKAPTHAGKTLSIHPKR